MYRGGVTFLTACRRTSLTGLILLAASSQAIDLADGWRVRTGDDPSWAQSDHDDSGWQPIEVGRPWEEAGLGDYDGYAWYRLHVAVPEHIRDDGYVRHYRKLILSLGAIDDVDTTYFNGVQVGQTGSPGDNSGSWNLPRRYDVPVDAVRWGEANVVAVRVFDGDGAGGMWTGPFTLVAPAWRHVVEIDLGLGRGDGIFPSGAPMALSADIRNATIEPMEAVVSWGVESENWRVSERGPPLGRHRESLHIRPGIEARSKYRFTPPAPGFYHVTCTLTATGDTERISRSMLLGYAPEQAVRPPEPPETLKAFWDEARRELAAIDPDFKVIPAPEHSTAASDCFLVEMRSLDNVLIRGWYQIPTSPGPHPALLRVPGYTGAMQPDGHRADMVVLSLNIRGHGNSQDDVPGGKPDFLLRGIGDPGTFFYRGAYMDCIRAMDFLVSRPEVDPDRMGVTGGSQGGMLSLATAALDSRVALCAPDIPFVVDSARGFHITPWPGSVIRDWIAEDPATRSWDQIRELYRFFDPKNLAGWIRCPVFMGIGLQDPVCPAPTNFAAYNPITAEKEYRVYPYAGHGLPPEHGRARIAWIRRQFKLDSGQPHRSGTQAGAPEPRMSNGPTEDSAMLPRKTDGYRFM